MRELYLNDNLIKEISAEITQFVNLHKFDSSNNPMKEIPQQILDDLPKCYITWRSLKSIDSISNDITRVDQN